jgi:hypothetical protein
MTFLEGETVGKIIPFVATNPFGLGRTNPTAGFRLLDPNSPFSSNVARDFGRMLAHRTLTLEDPSKEEHITQLMRLAGWPTSQSLWTSTTPEPHQTEGEEEGLPEATGITEDPVVTPGAMQPRLVPTIPLALFASTVDSQDTLHETVPSNVEDETRPTMSM